MSNNSGFPGRATAPGSSNYYCVRMAPKNIRADLALIFEWKYELQEILHRCSDQGVALTKLQWYRNEILHNPTQHHLLQALIPVIHSHQLSIKPFMAIADGVETDIRGVMHHDSKALQYYCQLTGGSLLELLTAICGGNEQDLTCAQELGAFAQLVEIIRNLGRDLRLGCCRLPHKEMEQQNLNPTKLTEPQNDQALQALLADLYTIANNEYASTLESLPAGRHPTLIPALAQAAMSHALLYEVKKTAFPVINQRTSLTPLRKLWIVWRTNRRYR
ncbi:Phytoene synthase [hydrothermal vent metagenome]|uniref:Phytoene synthase n=1 Tax=hydrothermal vent metagenome TaxID=652676 RepID=A0A3B1BFC6_9ZZZZ